MMKEVNSKEKNFFKKLHELFFLSSVITPMTKNKHTRDDPKDIQLFILTIFWDPRCNANLIRVYKCFYINESKTNVKLTHTPPSPTQVLSLTKLPQMGSSTLNSFIIAVQWLSRVQLFVTPWTAASQASLSFTIFQSLHKRTSIESVMLSNRLILCHPLLLLPFTFPSIRVFSNKSALCIRYPKYWSFSISPFNEYSG